MIDITWFTDIIQLTEIAKNLNAKRLVNNAQSWELLRFKTIAPLSQNSTFRETGSGHLRGSGPNWRKQTCN